MEGVACQGTGFEAELGCEVTSSLMGKVVRGRMIVAFITLVQLCGYAR